LSGWAVTEAALAKAHEQMRLAIKAGRIFFFDWNIRSGAVEWSDGLEAELGLAPGGFDGRIETFRSLVYPDDLPIVEAALAKSLDEGVPYEPEFRMRRADGTLRWVVVRSTVFRDANGKPLRMVGADIDITEQKRTESRLRDTKQNLRAALAELDAIYNAAPIGLGFVDRDLRYQRVNAAWSASNGLTAAQMIGQRVPDLVPGLWPALEPIYQRVLERGEAVDDVVVSGTVPKGEGRREWLGSYWPVWDAQGAVVGATVAFRDVTEARRAEQALQRTLAELEAIYDTAPIGLAVLDRDLVYRRVNRQLAAMRGITVDEMIGRHVNDVIPYFTPTLLPVLRDVLDAGTPQLNVELQADYPAGSGNHRYWNCSYLPLRDAHTDQVAAVVALVTEVTEAREAAARLSESEASFRTLADALPAFVFVTSPAGENRYINSFTAAFTGMTLEKVLDQGWVSFIHPEDQARARRLWQEALASGRPYHAEYRIRRHDGEWRWLLVQALPQHDANNCIARWIGTAVDISDLRTAEAALRAGEERLRLATEAGGVGIFDWDLRTGALLWDERLRSLWGVVPDAPLTIDAFYGGLHPEDVPRLQAILAAALDPAGSGDYQAEFRVIHGADGSERIISAHGRATFENGTAVRMVGTGVDVTTRRQAEAVLARDKAELEQRVAERTKALTEAAAELTAEMRRREEAQQALTQGQKLEALGHLTSGIAHDFNNVLAAVTGSLELIGRRTKDNPRVQSLVHNGEQAAERAATLVRQLLTFARREAPAPEAYDPAALIGSVDTLIVRAIGSGVTIAVDIPADAWPIMVDAHRLEVALLNLAVNGRDAMEGVGELTLSARNEPASGSRSDDPALPDARPAGLNQVADYVVIAMRDSGPGMPPEVLARASEAFFTTKPPGEGTGLGLSMVRAFAEQSGGALRILSPPGEGATVELWLPRAAEPVQPQAVDAAEPDEALHGGATILVVDDDDQVRLVTATTLRDRGYTVVEASSMRSALVQAGAGERIDLVITDVTMPGGDGMQLARQLRNRWPRLPVLFISGHVYREGLEQEVVLAKPFSPAVLADQVLASLGRRPGPPRTDQLLLRLKSGDLRSAYSLWQSLRQEAGPKRGLPRFAGVDLHALAGASHAYAVAVEGEADRPVFRFVHVGAALAARLGRPLEGMVALAEDDDVVFGGMVTAWTRCARTGAPHYDYARYSLGDGADPVAFERLLLPMSNDGGEGVSHIIGLAAFYGVLGQERANAGQQT
ncbi:MAG: PAS domain-containing protein, partial [Proteobacteria bacterium]|nr:PAS domain-containing protein [Pseudomonadota bacterium]